MYENLISRINANIVLDTNGCFIWQRCKNDKGYGHLMYEGRVCSVHRLAWMATYGEIPHKLHVLHKCDVPSCCNPEHLFLGTNMDNVKDRVSKNRQAKGIRCGTAVLTEREVLEIREKYSTGIFTTRELAKEYDMGKTIICSIINRLKWKHI